MVLVLVLVLVLAAVVLMTVVVLMTLVVLAVVVLAVVVCSLTPALKGSSIRHRGHNRNVVSAIADNPRSPFLSKDGPALPEGWEMVPYPEAGSNRFKFVNEQLEMAIKYPPHSERGLAETAAKLTSRGAGASVVSPPPGGLATPGE
jgi:hypothetical protein